MGGGGKIYVRGGENKPNKDIEKLKRNILS